MPISSRSSATSTASANSIPEAILLEHWIGAWHSINTMLPLTVPVTKLAEERRASKPRRPALPPDQG